MKFVFERVFSVIFQKKKMSLLSHPKINVNMHLRLRESLLNHVCTSQFANTETIQYKTLSQLIIKCKHIFIRK